MPNWVTNEIIIYAPQQVINKIETEVINENDEFDFNLLIPMPEHIFCGSVGPEEFEKYGEDNWYDWSIKNWGTKWNCNDSYMRKPKEDCLKIYFSTAWSTPYPIVMAFPKLYDIISIECKYADEDMGYNCGCYGWSEYDGEYTLCIDDEYRFAKRMWGYK